MQRFSLSVNYPALRDGYRFVVETGRPTWRRGYAGCAIRCISNGLLGCSKRFVSYPSGAQEGLLDMGKTGLRQGNSSLVKQVASEMIMRYGREHAGELACACAEVAERKGFDISSSVWRGVAASLRDRLRIGPIIANDN